MIRDTRRVSRGLTRLARSSTRSQRPAFVGHLGDEVLDVLGPPRVVEQLPGVVAGLQVPLLPVAVLTQNSHMVALIPLLCYYDTEFTRRDRHIQECCPRAGTSVAAGFSQEEDARWRRQRRRQRHRRRLPRPRRLRQEEGARREGLPNRPQGSSGPEGGPQSRSGEEGPRGQGAEAGRAREEVPQAGLRLQRDVRAAEGRGFRGRFGLHSRRVQQLVRGRASARAGGRRGTSRSPSSSRPAAPIASGT